MPTITISVRDVDLDVWKEFQKRIKGLWGLKERYRKQWERITKGDLVLIYSGGDQS